MAKNLIFWYFGNCITLNFRKSPDNDILIFYLACLEIAMQITCKYYVRRDFISALYINSSTCFDFDSNQGTYAAAADIPN